MQPLESQVKAQRHTGSAKAASGSSPELAQTAECLQFGDLSLRPTLPAGRGVGCSKGERQEGSPSPRSRGRQQGWLPRSAFPWEHPGGKAATRSSEWDTRWPCTLAHAPKAARCSRCPRKPTRDRLLNYYSRKLSETLQRQTSAGLRKPRFPPKLTLSQARQGTCLPHSHSEGTYSWNLLFTQLQIRELTP